MSSQLQADLISGIPYVAQYLGAWAMTEQGLDALQKEAESVDVRHHLAQSQSTKTVVGDDPQLEVLPSGVSIAKLHGPMMKHRSSFASNTSTVEVRRQIRFAKQANQVNSLLLHIDSCGGTVSGIDDLAKDIESFGREKPIVAYIEDLGASAAYWAAAQADKIYTNAQAIVGYIGVLQVVKDLSEAANKAGIKVHRIKFGEFKGAGLPGTEIADAELAEFQREVDTFGEMFVSAVAKGRGISRDAALALSDSRVHIGQAAVDIGLTDGVRSLDEVLEDLAARGAASTKGRTTVMSTTTTEPVGATLHELEAALPDADATFVLEQLKAKATVDEAQQRFSAKRISELEAKVNEQKERESQLKDDLEAAKQQANTDPPPATARTTQQPLGSNDPAPEPVTFESLVAEEMKKGTSRREASRQLAKIHPDLFEAYLDKAPDLRSSFQRDTLKV